jgi:aspartokinase-like uncharacterized kinase
MRVRVINVGGSLFDLPDLPQRLRGWLARQTPAQNVFIAGGGRFVDELRAFDKLHHLGDEACHWLAIRAMSVTAQLLHALVPEWPLVMRWQELADVGGSIERGATAILDPLEFLRTDETNDDPLPHSWNVTSDSIAAHLANRVRQAGPPAELVLLKSRSPPDGCDAAQAAACGYVDAHFPVEAHGLIVACIDLRDPACPCQSL